MMAGHLVLSLLLGLLLAFLLGAVAKNGRSDFESVGLLALVLILGVWAGGVWLPDLGPAVFGIHPMPFVLAGSAIGLGVLFLAVTARRRLLAMPGPGWRPGAHPGRRPAMVLGLWTLALMLIGAIAYRYLSA